ncbi:MAG: TIR domain-containing protein [Armatimonadota bacterium]
MADLSNEASIRWGYLGVKLAEILWRDTTWPKVDLYAKELFGFDADMLEPAHISSPAARHAYSWVVALGEQDIPPAQKIRLLGEFAAEIANDEGEFWRLLSEIKIGGAVLPRAEKEQAMEQRSKTLAWVIHGRNADARDAVFDFLRCVGIKPLEWGEVCNETGTASPYVGEVLDTAFALAQVVVVILSGDDMAFLRPELRSPDDPTWEGEETPQARPNVLFEAGMAFGTHQDRTIIVQWGHLRPFSDIGGRHVLRLVDTPECRQDFVGRLRTARCEVDAAGTDWLKAGNFPNVDL